MHIVPLHIGPPYPYNHNYCPHCGRPYYTAAPYWTQPPYWYVTSTPGIITTASKEPENDR